MGVTWSHDSSVGEDDLAISLSTSDRGRWTDFEPMSFDPDHEPEPSSPEAQRTVRPGTDALVVGSVDAVRVRVRALAGALPEDLQLAVIDPGVDRDDGAPAGVQRSPEGESPRPSSRATPRRRRC